MWLSLFGGEWREKKGPWKEGQGGERKGGECLQLAGMQPTPVTMLKGLVPQDSDAASHHPGTASDVPPTQAPWTDTQSTATILQRL